MGLRDREIIKPEDFQKMTGADFIEKLANFPGGKEYLSGLTLEQIKTLGHEFESGQKTYGNDQEKIMQYFIAQRHMPADVAQAIMYEPSVLEQGKMAVTNRIADWKDGVDRDIALAQDALRGSPDRGIRHRQLDNAERQAVGAPSM